jgi:microcystin degradation protein MlrC
MKKKEGVFRDTLLFLTLDLHLNIPKTLIEKLDGFILHQYPQGIHSFYGTQRKV